MHYYAAPQCPSCLLISKSKSEKHARFKAAQELSTLIADGSLKVKMPNGFSTRQFIRITKEDLMSNNEEEISNAVKVLSKLSKAKEKVQRLHELSLEAYESIDCLFEEAFITVEKYQEIEISLRTIHDYAKAASAYKEALPESKQARDFLAEALTLTE